jgi:hypothetical protein
MKRKHYAVMGSIDRVTGEVEAGQMLMDVKRERSTSYSLKCRPTQRNVLKTNGSVQVNA